MVHTRESTKQLPRRTLRSRLVAAAAALVLSCTPFTACTANAAEPLPSAEHYRKTVQPILEQYCYECHADGVDKGGVTFDNLKSDEQIAKQPQLWWRVLKNVRAGMMPPPKADHLPPADRAVLEKWIKYDGFGLDAKAPDPGRVTVRRLNRTEYRNTIRDLMGVDFKVDEEFPPDDTGYGFDNIGDVLTTSPLLLEKYMQAAEKIVGDAVPRVSKVIAERTYTGADFNVGYTLNLYKPNKANRTLKTSVAGTYRLAATVGVNSPFDFDPGRSKLTFKVDGKEIAARELNWGDGQNGSKVELKHELKLEPGDHPVTLEFEPLESIDKKKDGLSAKVITVQLTGPLEKEHWSSPPNYDRFFFKPEPPTSDGDRAAYAREILRRFTLKAFRRPADDRTLNRLMKIAEATYHQPNKSFEDGIAEAMVAALSSPRFLFRVEDVVASANDGRSAPIDEYALATRLSYFLWSTMPDEALFQAAEKGELRKNLAAQVDRMLKDPRSDALVQNFVGQWMQTRDVENLSVNLRAVLGVSLRNDGERQKAESDMRKVRQAMHRETEMYFAYVLRENRSILEFLDSDYTFVNDKLAAHYGIEGVTGSEMRKITLPKGSPRGGLLTQGTVLLVTSNPTRTSPVKRGLFVLDNILGTPAPPAPPDVPQLEESLKAKSGHEPTLREALEAHRSKPLCASCHARMDPIGFALENFNALGMYRDKEKGQPIDAAGKLITGEQFTDIRQLKAVLKEKHKLDFYRCLTEKMMTYALGRGMEYYDTESIDQIVDRLDHNNGKFATLLTGVIDSAPFQRRRTIAVPDDRKPGASPTGTNLRADVRN